LDVPRQVAVIFASGNSDGADYQARTERQIPVFVAEPTPFNADVLKAAREQKLVVGEPRPSVSLLVKFWLLEFYFFLNAPSVRDDLLWSKAASAFLN
jgi:hypothetical protein